MSVKTFHILMVYGMYAFTYLAVKNGYIETLVAQIISSVDNCIE